jgi:hypothetical protein
MNQRMNSWLKHPEGCKDVQTASDLAELLSFLVIYTSRP